MADFDFWPRVPLCYSEAYSLQACNCLFFLFSLVGSKGLLKDVLWRAGCNYRICPAFFFLSFYLLTAFAAYL